MSALSLKESIARFSAVPQVSYDDFLRAKMCLAPSRGFECELDEIHPFLHGKPHEAAVVQWGVRGGRRAYFEAFGLGKTVQQLETVRIILRKLGTGRGLIICPLGVRQEFMRDAAKLGLAPTFVRRSEDVDADGLYLTNYESVRDGNLDPDLFSVVSLDEAAVLRGYGTKTFQSFLTLFANVPYRFVATATPSPNRFKELIHYAGFLGVMDTGEALTRFFQRDSTKANNLTLHPHKEQEFWLWVSSWAVFLQRPSDLGFSDEGYDLPDVDVVWHELPASHAFGGADRDGQVALLPDASMGLKEAAHEKRDSLPERVARAATIIETGGPDKHWIVWHHLEDERHEIQRQIPEAVSVWGTQDLDERERRVIDFSEGRTRILSTKPSVAGVGCNFQRHCHSAIFTGIDYKFHDFIQAVHRIQRFQQTKRCEIHIVYTEAEREIKRSFLAKWEQHKQMTERMSEIIRQNGLATTSAEQLLLRSLGCERVEVSGKRFAVANNDAVYEARRMADNSVDLIITSIPFSNHYEYTPSYNDFGHTRDNEHFWEQMSYLTPELLRILKPGRIACIHVKDRIQFGNQHGTGLPTRSLFHAEALFHYTGLGFDLLDMITVVMDVVRENNQTYRLGYTEMCKDGTKMGVGSPEYILILHKPQTDRTKGYADEPVTKEKPKCIKPGEFINFQGEEIALEDEIVDFDRKLRPIPGTGYSLARWQIDAHAFWRSSGDRHLKPEEMAAYGPGALAKIYTDYSLTTLYDYDFHVRIGEELAFNLTLPTEFMALAPGSPDPSVWHDINRMLTLNGAQAAKGKELHICPLQTDIIKRLIGRYSNAGDFVYDPFSGLHSVAYMAIKMGRRGGGSELNTGYFMDGLAHLRRVEAELDAPSLFDFEKAEADDVDAPDEAGARELAGAI